MFVTLTSNNGQKWNQTNRAGAAPLREEFQELFAHTRTRLSERYANNGYKYLCVFLCASSRISLVYLARGFFSPSIHHQGAHKRTHRHSRVWSSAHNIHLLRTSNPPSTAPHSPHQQQAPPPPTPSSSSSSSCAYFFVSVFAGSAGRYALALAPLRRSRRNSQQNHPPTHNPPARPPSMQTFCVRTPARTRARKRRIRLRADTKPCISLIYGRSDTTQRARRRGRGVGGVSGSGGEGSGTRGRGVRARRQQSQRRERASVRARARNCRKW